MVVKVIPSLYARGKLSQVSPLSIKEIRANLRRQHASYQGMRTITAIVPHDPPVHKTQRKSLRVDFQDPQLKQDSAQEDPNWWPSNYAQLAVRDSSPMRRPPCVPYQPPAGLPSAPHEDFHAYLEHPESGPSAPPVMPAELTGSLLHPDHTDGTHHVLYYPYASSVQGGCWQGPNTYFRNRFLEAYLNAGRRKY